MMSYLRNFSTLPFISFALISLALTGCTTTDTQGPKSSGPAVPFDKVISLPTPAKDSDILYGEERDDLSVIQNAYQRDQKNAMLAARYGKALREANKVKEAKTVLLPWSENTEAGTLVNSELSAIYLSENNLDKAEFAARKAIKADNANYRAWRDLGNALDAQEKYVEGETAFRRSLALWTGKDKVPIMNNLALNLAAQGKTDQALELLYQAQKIKPDLKDIERNIRIIRALSEPPEFAREKKPFPETKEPN